MINSWCRSGGRIVTPSPDGACFRCLWLRFPPPLHGGHDRNDNDECPPIVDEIILTSYDMNTKVPFFLVDFSDLGWQIGVGFNMPREPRFRRQRFLSDDTHNRVNLVLCDYPTALILAIRGIDIRIVSPMVSVKSGSN